MERIEGLPDGSRTWLEIVLAGIWAVGGILTGTVVGSFTAGADGTLVGGASGLLAALASWPAIASKADGREPPVIPVEIRKQDWIFGPLIAAAMFAAASIFSLIAELAGADVSSGDGQFVDDMATSSGVGLMFLLVVVVGPTVEEFFFRGWLLRSVAGSGPGPQRQLLGALISAAVFAAAHIPVGSPALVAVMSATLFALGLILAAAALRFDRLGPGIIGHMVYNAVAFALVL